MNANLSSPTLLAVALFASVRTHAEESPALVNASAPQELFSAGYLAQVLGSLVLVFVCLFAVVYVLRRFNGVRIGPGTPLRVLGSASVGQREKVVLIEAGKEQLLLGVAQGSVRTLHVFDEPVLTAEAGEQARPDFASVLRAANPLGGGS